jgi:hypothetical protein
MADLLQAVKSNLIITHTDDDTQIQSYIDAAVAYAESYQRKGLGYYATSEMANTTKQAIVMLASHFYESRDGSTGGYFADNVQASQQVWATVNLLLGCDKDWVV